MLSFTMTIDGMMTIQNFVDGVKEWMSHIEMDKDKYSIEVMPGFDSYPFYGRIAVKFEAKILFYANFYRKYGRSSNGKKTINGVFTVSFLNEGLNLYRGEELTLNVNDRLETSYKGKNTNIAQALSDVLPIRDEGKVAKIASAFDISSEQIKFDTYKKHYVVDITIPELLKPQVAVPDTFYKYMSLFTFHKILTNRTFRMHSIVSQSDYTESLYLGDLLCADYENEEDRFRGILKEKNVLISSFSDKYDDRYMWENYGDKGKGVRLSFKNVDDKPLTSILYVNKKATNLWTYREKVNQLKKEGIRVHFKAVDGIHRFVKDDKYEKEHEWRLVLENQTDLKTDVYNDGRMVWYKDFPFQGTLLNAAGLQLEGILIGPRQTSNNFPILVDSIINAFGEGIIVNWSNCK